MDSRKTVSILTAILICLSICAPVAADNTAMAIVSGTVVDIKGGAVARAKLTAINDARGLQRETVTNDEGYFEILFLPTGVYTLTVEMPGFAIIRVTQLEAQSGVNRRLMIVLQPKGRAETITVKASSVTVEANDATLKYSITREQTETYPIIATNTGRPILETLPLLVPGVTPWFNFGIRGENLSINGGRPLANVFLLNGGDNTDPELSIAASPFPNPDALQEVTIVTNNYKADLGGGTGGIINVITRSGGNQFHGSFRDMFSHEALNARYFFSPGKGRYYLNMFGGQMEGPITIPGLYSGRDRTHFFFDVEGKRTSYESTYDIDVIPREEREGDFSAYPDYDPDNPYAPYKPIDPETGLPFPGGKIPANRIDPIARLYLDRFVPMSNLSSNTVEGTYKSGMNYNQATARVDHKLTESDSVSATYFYNAGSSRYSTYELPEGIRTISRKDQNFVLNHAHIFSATATNQLTATLNRSIQFDRVEQPGFTGIHPREFGFTGVRPQTDRFLALPHVSIYARRPDFNDINVDIGYSDSGTKEGYKTTLSLRDDFTRVRGSHSFGFGGGARSFLFNNYIPNNNGAFGFDDNNQETTGNGMADFLLGLPSSYYQTTGSIQHQRQWSYFAYAMDDWKARGSLTINLGLRYEFAPPVTDKQNQVVVFRPGEKSRRFPNAPVGALFAGDTDPVLGTVPRGGYPTDYNNLAPRIGIAFSPSSKSGWLRRVFGDGKTVIRAGFGMFYAATYGQHFTEFAQLEPFTSGVAFYSFALPPYRITGNFANPFGSSPNPFPIALEDRRTFFYNQIHTFDPSFRTAYTYHYNLTIQREMPGQIQLEIAYVGNNSFHTDRERELNATYDRQERTNLLRYPQFYHILSQESSGRARYDSFQLRLSRKFRGGLMFDGFYVYSKALDNSSGPLSSQDFRGRYYFSHDKPNVTDPFDQGRSAFDRRHNLVISYVYDLPFRKESGLLSLLAGGWRLGGATQIRSGLPLDIYGDYDAYFQDRPDLVGSYRRFDPKEVRTLNVNGKEVTGNFFFDPTAFRQTTTRDGNLGRNVFDGPGFNFTSISISKRTPLFKTHEAEIRADIFNLFNQVNFGSPDEDITSSTFGQVRSAASARWIQLSLRYRF
jgi:hypothetical protein